MPRHTCFPTESSGVPRKLFFFEPYVSVGQTIRGTCALREILCSKKCATNFFVKKSAQQIYLLKKVRRKEKKAFSIICATNQKKFVKHCSKISISLHFQQNKTFLNFSSLNLRSFPQAILPLQFYLDSAIPS